MYGLFLPYRYKYQNLIVDTIQKTKDGFNFSFSYGSRNRYELTLYFVFAHSRFYLLKLKRSVIDIRKPEKIYSDKQFYYRPIIPMENVRIEKLIKEVNIHAASSVQNAR